MSKKIDKKKRYSKSNADILHTAASLRREIIERVHEYMEEKHIRNRSYAIEILVEKGLDCDKRHNHEIDSKAI
jgi:hypothetical protein